MDEDETLNYIEHDALIDEIKNIGKKTKTKKVIKKKIIKKTATRSKTSVLEDLVGAIKSTKNVSELKKQLAPEDLKERKKRKTLNVPLHRQARERVEGAYAYRESKKELRQWAPIVGTNRVAEQLFFPLNDPQTFYLDSASDKTKSFTPRTGLEKRLAEALGKSKNVFQEDELYTEAEKEIIKAMDLNEAKKRTQELQRVRRLMSYSAAKAARQSRIKSKNYHRVRKRAKRKELIKEIEDLLAKDPEAAKEKLKELELDRIQERGTLKHRGTSKWSVQLKQYASRNPQMQSLLAEHLKLGRELKRKQSGLANALDSDESDEEEAVEKPLTKGEMIALAAETAHREVNEETRKANIRADMETDNTEPNRWLENKIKTTRKTAEEINLDEVTLAPDDILAKNFDEDLVEDDNFLAEAFDADDVVGEFNKRKEELEENDTDKVVNEAMFGWGAWTGEGISEESQKKRIAKFAKIKKGRKRADKGKAQVIIQDTEANEKLAQLQPSDVPFPFTAVKDFEAVIRQPLGRDWNTNIAHQNLVKRSVVTKAGRIIRPMDKNVELKKTADALLEDKNDDDKFEELLR